jgi:hypothetical protein
MSRRISEERRESESVLEVIRQGDVDIEAKNYRNLDEFMSEFRTRNGIPAPPELT